MLVNLKAIASPITNEELLQLSSDNPDTRFETTKKGELIIMSPTGGSTGRKNINLASQVWNWNEKHKLGEAFDSSTGFTLPNGAIRSPDVSWVKLNRWNQLTSEEQDKFSPIAPDFVIELKPKTDRLQDLQQKMEEYIECGIKLGWLINPQDKQVEVYCQEDSRQILNNPQEVFNNKILPGLILNLTDILN